MVEQNGSAERFRTSGGRAAASLWAKQLFGDGYLARRGIVAAVIDDVAALVD